MGRASSAHRGLTIALLGMSLLGMMRRPAAGQAVAPAADRIRSAAALQNRELYDLAAAEWEAIANEFPADALAAEARYQRGVCLFQLARFADACNAFQELLRESDGLEEALEEKCLAHLGLAHYNLATVAEGKHRAEEFDAAATFLGQQLAKYPHGSLAARSMFFRGEALYALGRHRDAIDVYRKLLDRFPQYPQRAEALFALGVAEQEANQIETAAESLAQFIAEYPDHAMVGDAQSRRAEALLALGEARLRAGDPAAADAVLSQFLSDYPAHGRAREARLLRATARYQSDEYAAGIADAIALLVADPPRPIASQALHIRGLCEAGLGKSADAIQTFERIVREDPQYAALDRVLYDLAWVYEEAGRSERATATFARLANLRPSSPLAAECLYRVAESRYAAGEFAPAAEQYRAAIERAGAAALAERAAHKLGWCFFEQRQFANAESAFGDQLTRHPDGPLAADAQLMLAECQFRQGKHREACETYTAAFRRPAESGLARTSALVHAAQAAARLGDWQRSHDFADRAVRENATDHVAAEARCARGVASFHLGRLDESERDLDAVAGEQHSSVAAEARFILGQIQRARGRHDDAIRRYFQVAYGDWGDRAPDSVRHWQAEALFAAAECLQETHRHEAARKLYDELVERFPESARARSARAGLEGAARR